MLIRRLYNLLRLARGRIGFIRETRGGNDYRQHKYRYTSSRQSSTITMSAAVMAATATATAIADLSDTVVSKQMPQMTKQIPNISDRIPKVSQQLVKVVEPLTQSRVDRQSSYAMSTFAIRSAILQDICKVITKEPYYKPNLAKQPDRVYNVCQQTRQLYLKFFRTRKPNLQTPARRRRFFSHNQAQTKSDKIRSAIARFSAQFHLNEKSFKLRTKSPQYYPLKANPHPISKYKYKFNIHDPVARYIKSARDEHCYAFSNWISRSERRVVIARAHRDRLEQHRNQMRWSTYTRYDLSNLRLIAKQRDTILLKKLLHPSVQTIFNRLAENGLKLPARQIFDIADKRKVDRTIVDLILSCPRRGMSNLASRFRPMYTKRGEARSLNAKLLRLLSSKSLQASPEKLVPAITKIMTDSKYAPNAATFDMMIKRLVFVQNLSLTAVIALDTMLYMGIDVSPSTVISVIKVAESSNIFLIFKIVMAMIDSKSHNDAITNEQLSSIFENPKLIQVIQTAAIRFKNKTLYRKFRSEYIRRKYIPTVTVLNLELRYACLNHDYELFQDVWTVYKFMESRDYFEPNLDAYVWASRATQNAGDLQAINQIVTSAAQHGFLQAILEKSPKL
ncbi:uncharacterized protein V1516DRAFT_674182 [Lipomyces oligophaga]|uniref:uncharacterized protein n=1 Tax=Lipomyces oligophaga TaxID=45792 RepID=UPI0034D008C6